MIRITEDHEYYMRCFAVYQSGFNAEAITCKALADETPVALEKVWPNAEPGKEISVLSVGGGAGAIDIPMLSAIAQHFGTNDKKATIYNTVVEPNVPYLRKYKDLMECLPEKRARIYCEFFEKTFQDYVTERGSNARKSDFVHFIHSLYYIPKPEILEYTFYNILKEKGIIIAILVYGDGEGEKRGWQIADFQERCFGDKFLSDLALDSDHVINIAKKNNWQYETHRYVIPHDISEVFTNEESGKSNMLLDFYTHYKNFRKTAGKERVTATLEFIKSVCETDKDGRLLFKEGFDLVIIYKGDTLKKNDLG
ncbi:histamine N-methyltransferase-like [Nematostella vectensis]|uniref:histamine N-methyltransferase-like n=1 Tax=Nematostella vectensis TaxID=45351 RepID=UPI002076DDBD|nr:histamine N-methyltransferase-like [Nematostella vectensis]